MLEPNFHKTVEKFLKKLPAKQAKQIFTRIQELCLNPKPNDSELMKNYVDT